MQDTKRLCFANTQFHDYNLVNFQLRFKLLLLICELTASPTIYQLKDDSGNLLKYANDLASKLSSHWWESTDDQFLKYYEKKLHRDCWKRQLGAVHGFGRYLEVYTNRQIFIQIVQFVHLLYPAASLRKEIRNVHPNVGFCTIRGS